MREMKVSKLEAIKIQIFRIEFVMVFVMVKEKPSTNNFVLIGFDYIMEFGLGT